MLLVGLLGTGFVRSSFRTQGRVARRTRWDHVWSETLWIGPKVFLGLMRGVCIAFSVAARPPFVLSVGVH